MNMYFTVKKETYFSNMCVIIWKKKKKRRQKEKMSKKTEEYKLSKIFINQSIAAKTASLIRQIDWCKIISPIANCIFLSTSWKQHFSNSFWKSSLLKPFQCREKKTFRQSFRKLIPYISIFSLAFYVLGVALPLGSVLTVGPRAQRKCSVINHILLRRENQSCGGREKKSFFSDYGRKFFRFCFRNQKPSEQRCK